MALSSRYAGKKRQAKYRRDLPPPARPAEPRARRRSCGRGGSGELGAAALAAASGAHRAPAHGALGAPVGRQLTPDAEDRVLERRPARLKEPLSMRLRAVGS
jgi:hypothetical protein